MALPPRHPGNGCALKPEMAPRSPCVVALIGLGDTLQEFHGLYVVATLAHPINDR